MNFPHRGMNKVFSILFCMCVCVYTALSYCFFVFSLTVSSQFNRLMLLDPKRIKIMY